jgi:hypothetical protein
MKAILLTFLFLLGCTYSEQEDKPIEETIVEKKEIKIPNWDDPIFKNWCSESHENCKNHQK